MVVTLQAPPVPDLSRCCVSPGMGRSACDIPGPTL